MRNRVNIKSLIWQTILYRMISIITSITLLSLFTKSIQKGISYGISIHIIMILIYFLYHYGFLRWTNIIKKNKGFTLWFTGLPCSGKTTVADCVANELLSQDINAVRLDGDIVRKSLTKDLGFSKDDRAKNIERVTFVAKLLSENGVGAICSFISPYIEIRNNIRQETTNFIEVFVKASPEECSKRDVKGMWAKAKAGEIKGFTGHDDPYEIPVQPEIVLDTENESIEESKEKVISYLKSKRLL